MSIYTRMDSTVKRLLAKYDTRVTVSTITPYPLTTEVSGTGTFTDYTATASVPYIILTSAYTPFSDTKTYYSFTLSAIAAGDACYISFTRVNLASALGIIFQNVAGVYKARLCNIASQGTAVDTTFTYVTGDELAIAIDKNASLYGTLYFYRLGVLVVSYELESAPASDPTSFGCYFNSLSQSTVFTLKETPTYPIADATLFGAATETVNSKMMIKRRTAGSINSTTGVFTAGTLSSIELTGIVKTYNSRQIDGVSILTGDLLLIVDSTTEVLGDDNILIDGDIYTVVSINIVKPSASALMYKVQVRK
jgi:hypothetical protein